MFFVEQAFISELCIAGMSATAIAAAVTDWRSWRIPNVLLAASAAAALMLALFDPASLTLKDALLGGLAGLLLLLPFYCLRGMAAGDVKLMAVIGLYVGPLAVLDIALLSFLLGGAWSALVLAARSPHVTWGLLGFRYWVGSERMDRDRPPAPETGLKTRRGVFPFGVAIGIATLAMAATAMTHRSAG